MFCGTFTQNVLPLFLPCYHHCVRYLRRMCCLCPLHGFTTLWDICAGCAALVPSMVSPLCGISALHMLPLSLPWYPPSVGYLRRMCCPCPFHGITTLWDICAACAALAPSIVSPLCGIFAPHMLPLSFPWYHHCGISVPHMLPLSLPWYHHSVGYLHCICCLCPFHDITHLWDICAACAALVPSMVSPLCGISALHMLPLSLP